MKRVAFGNLVIYSNTNIVLVNLFNFRRKILSMPDFDMLISIDKKIYQNKDLDLPERKLYESLMEEKQILSSDIIEQTDLLRKNKYKNISKAINVFTISPTFDCNFRCNYCYQRNFKKNSGTMTVEHINKIHDFLINYHKEVNEKMEVLGIAVNGGEPLLDKNIPVVNHILAKFSNCQESILFTNGVNIIKNSKKIDYTQFKEVQVSLDGDDNLIPVVNNFNTPVFNTIIQGILYLTKLGIKITVMCMLTNELIINLDKFIEKLRNEGIIDNKSINIRVGCVSDFREGLDKDFFSIEELSTLRPYLFNLFKGTNIALDDLHEVRWIKKALTRRLNEKFWGSEATCGVTEVRPLIFAPNGKIYWCTCVDPEQGILGEYFPNVSFDHEIFSQYLQRNVLNLLECKKCDFRYICSGGCVLHSIKQKKLANTPHCGYFKNEFFLNNIEKFI